MSGRDPEEEARVSTPLELLYDLTFAVAFGTAAEQLAHYLALDHIRTAIIGFLFGAFAICWAWVNYSWFASAYNNDDWITRLLTMVQMIGVIVLALGLQRMFESVDRGGSLQNGVMVGGYVVMRVGMLLLWARAARHDEARRRIAKTYIWAISISQTGWVLLAVAQLPVATSLALATLLLLVELAGPWIAERKKGSGGTPWHPHHIAERYGLLVIITLGEGIVGTVAALNAVVHGPQGWSLNAALVALAGVSLTFALFVLWMSVAGDRDPFHFALLAAAAALLLLSVLLASWGVAMAVCLVVLACAPIVTVVGFETIGYRHLSEVMKRTHAHGISSGRRN